MANNVLKNKFLSLVNMMTGDKETDNEIVKREVPRLFKEQKNMSLLHELLTELYPEDECAKLVYSLIDCGADINSSIDEYYGSFIHTAIVTGYSGDFIEDILSYALYMGLNPNIISDRLFDDDNCFNCTGSAGNTIIHTAIYCKYFTGSISNIYGLLVNAGYNVGYKNSIDETAFEAYFKHMVTTDETLQELQAMYDIEKNSELSEDEERAIGYERTVSTLLSLIPKMTGELETDVKLVNETIDVNWIGPGGQTLLHVLFDEKRV